VKLSKLLKEKGGVYEKDDSGGPNSTQTFDERCRKKVGGQTCPGKIGKVAPPKEKTTTGASGKEVPGRGCQNLMKFLGEEKKNLNPVNKTSHQVKKYVKKLTERGGEKGRGILKIT